MNRYRQWMVAIALLMILSGSCLWAGPESRRHGKKPYPEGTREKWIAEGRVLGRGPEGLRARMKGASGSADNRSYLPPIGNQGPEDSCVHWAGAYSAMTANMKRLNPSLDVTAASNQCSPRFTYNLVNAGVDNGSYGHEPFEIGMRYGVPSLQQMPYVAGQALGLPTVDDFVEGLSRRVANYVWVWQWNPDTNEINELKTFLDAGGVAVAGLYSDQSSFDLWKAGDPPWSGQPCSLFDIDHMVAVCGYGPGYYLIANSWGTSYGSNGFICVDANYFENYFSDVMYPLEGSTEEVTSYAKIQIKHSWRSDIRLLVFSVNGQCVWSNSPLPKTMPNGTGSFASDSRDDWNLAVDLSSAPWGGANLVTVMCYDSISSDSGSLTNFTVWYEGTNYVSGSTPVVIPNNTGVPATATVSFVTGPLAWDNGYRSIGGGWRRLSWFGDYVPMGNDGWIWHHKHGFFYVTGSSTPESIWLFTDDQGWLWTGSMTYPFLYRSSPSAWLWYNGSSSPRWFNNLTTSQWERWP